MISIFLGIMSAVWMFQYFLDSYDDIYQNGNTSLIISIGFLCLMSLTIITEKLNRLIADID